MVIFYFCLNVCSINKKSSKNPCVNTKEIELRFDFYWELEILTWELKEYNTYPLVTRSLKVKLVQVKEMQKQVLLVPIQ